MKYVLLDCYTDEAAGLGVPPYLGTYPRYIYGQLVDAGHEVTYLTIDDLRFWKIYDKKRDLNAIKTNIRIYNLTNNDAEFAIFDADVLVVIIGVHVPGKYLTAVPGTLREVLPLIKDFKLTKILTGPVLYGTQLVGGKFAENSSLKFFDEIKDFSASFDEVDKFALIGAGLIKQIPDRRMIEIETGRGCKVGKCSFCTEPLKAKFLNRGLESVLEEVKAFYVRGARFFRLGKQADFYVSDRPVKLLSELRKSCPDIEVLHIDNVNPNSVLAPGGREITEAIVKYCTSGNVAAFGVESFDFEVVRANLLNTTPASAFKAIKLINDLGGVRGCNGLPKFLPGINLIFGLLSESRFTHEKNMSVLKKIFDKGLLLRRINIRQASILPDTFLAKNGGSKFLKKNKRFFWRWREDIRQEIDFPMLKRVLPVGTVLKDVYTEMYDGNTTFCRQMGTYPLVIGVRGRLLLKKKISVEITGHMLRSVVAKIV